MVHSDSDLILHNSSVLIDKEPKELDKKRNQLFFITSWFLSSSFYRLFFLFRCFFTSIFL
ncbi:hypothetical protein EXV97_09395 [Enterococcus faecium]|nr:hypothetical protein F8A91_14105 [Enterococcus faecium]MDO8003336.1 hypothetical protein [Enterococcus faecium]MDO8028925.1 hypothetical protein [Enterococcus faecium]TKL79071.1 hypothetical protein DVW26_05985 [Enterococcus faecium]TKL83592.1 hypothetical protein DVW27_06180 [Enterococcus faecium]